MTIYSIYLILLGVIYVIVILKVGWIFIWLTDQLTHQKSDPIKLSYFAIVTVMGVVLVFLNFGNSQSFGLIVGVCAPLALYSLSDQTITVFLNKFEWLNMLVFVLSFVLMVVGGSLLWFISALMPDAKAFFSICGVLLGGGIGGLIESANALWMKHREAQTD